MSVVKVTDLVKRYGDLLAIDHLNLDIKRGEVFGLLGPNASGKTTTINCILQLLTYDKGEIELFGEKMTPTRYDLKARIGVVPQELAYFEELNVRDNVDHFCGLYVSDSKKRKELVDKAIEKVGLEKYVKFRPKKLSGGLKRRLNIACGIAHEPELIFFDEPTVAVDPQSRNSILQGILDANKEGATVVYTSHYMEEVEAICSRIAIIDHGNTIATGTNDELKAMISTGERIRIEIADITDKALNELQALDNVNTVTREDDILDIACRTGAHNLLDVLHVLNTHKVSYGRVYSDPPTLNDVFLELTGKELRD